MHVPEKWRIEDQEQIYSFMESYGFATLISPSLQASHLPIMLDRENQRLFGHFARSNPHWRDIADSNDQHLVIFNGPHSYISPNNYQSKPAVPTWNYAAVHVKGCANIMTNEETAQGLQLLMAKYEPELLKADSVVTAQYQEKLSKGIVGFSVAIETIEAKAKLGQHRSAADQSGVADALRHSTNADSQALYALMQKLKLGLGA